MSRKATQFVLTDLTAVDTSYYTVPANTYVEVLSITVANTAAGAAIATMRYSPGVHVLLRKSIAANDSYTERRFDVLTAGQSIRLQGTTSMSAIVSGVLVSP